jgi:hypothetical protein
VFVTVTSGGVIGVMGSSARVGRAVNVAMTEKIATKKMRNIWVMTDEILWFILFVVLT